MGRKEEVLAEIHKLIDEQLSVLGSALPSPGWHEYILRKRKIEELLDEIRRDGFGDR